MFPCLPAHTTFVADTYFVSWTQKRFLILFRNILCPQQMFRSLHSPRNIMGNNVSSFTRAFRYLMIQVKWTQRKFIYNVWSFRFYICNPFFQTLRLHTHFSLQEKNQVKWMIYHMHRNIIITKGLSQQKQVTNRFQFTSISGFQNDWMIIFATKKWAKSEYSTH